MKLQRILFMSRIVNFQKVHPRNDCISGFLKPKTVNKCTFNPEFLRYVSTVEVKPLQKEESLIRKILYKVPFLNVEHNRLASLSYFLYEAIADRINYSEFFQKFALPDTFYSWFVVTEMHIWMLSVRAMAEGDHGRIVRNSIVAALWTDVAQRVKKLGAVNPADTRLQIQELSEQLQAAFIAYDEGLQAGDAVLAAALWRRIYQQDEAFPEQLDLLVKYIRRQITFLDSLSKDQFLDQSNIKWEMVQNVIK